MAAREELARRKSVRYFDVQQDSSALREMLQLNGGVRQVPVIVEDGEVTIGFGGT